MRVTKGNQENFKTERITVEVGILKNHKTAIYNGLSKMNKMQWNKNENKEKYKGKIQGLETKYILK